MNKNNQKTIYQAGYAEIFLKNLLAGIARGLGGLFTWLILVFIGFKIFWPQISNQIDNLTTLVNNLSITPNMPNNHFIPKNFNKLFDQYVSK